MALLSLPVKILLFVVIVVAANLPFGSYRNITRKFSVAWFLSIHLPIPFVLVMRVIVFKLPLWTIPISLTADIAGQILGAKFNWFKKSEIEVALAEVEAETV